jgi:hypothetical protein
MNVLGLKISIDRDPSASVRWTRRTGVMGVAIVMVAGTGIAYAVWSANGSGSGTALAATALGVNGNVGTVSSSSTLLYPGSTAPLIVNIHNPNSFPVKVTAVTLTNNQQPNSIGGSPKNAATCTPASSAVQLVGSASATGLSTVIAAGGDGTVTLAGGVSMGSGSDDGCQTASFVYTSGISVTAASN